MKNNISKFIGTSLLTSLLASPAIAGGNNSVIDYARVTSVEPVYRYVTVREPYRQCEFVPARHNTRHNTRNSNRHNHRRNHNRQPRRFISGDSITNNKTDSAVIVGGVIGGTIGHQLSQSVNGRSDPAITLAGAVIGSALGHEVARNSSSHSNGRTTSRVSYSNSINSVESLQQHESPNSRLIKRRSGHNRHAGSHQHRLVERCTTTTISRQQRQLDGYDVTYVYRGNTFQTRTEQHPGDRIRVRVQVRPH